MKLLLKRKGVVEFFLLHIHGGGFALLSDLLTPNLQTTMLHTADAGGVLEADLDTFTIEKNHAATTETEEKDRTEKT